MQTPWQAATDPKGSTDNRLETSDKVLILFLYLQFYLGLQMPWVANNLKICLALVTNNASGYKQEREREGFNVGDKQSEQYIQRPRSANIA